jgi:hypothetical protein
MKMWMMSQKQTPAPKATRITSPGVSHSVHICSTCGLATRAVMTMRMAMKSVRTANPPSQTPVDTFASGSSLVFAVLTGQATKGKMRAIDAYE